MIVDGGRGRLLCLGAAVIGEKKMVSDADIVRRLTSVLKKADLSTTTTANIRKQLEKDLGVDLSDKKLFIREQVDLYFQQQQEAEEQQQQLEEQEAQEEEGEQDRDEEEEVEGEGEEEEEEQEQEKKKPTKARVKSQAPEPDSKRFKAKIDRAIKASLPKEKKKRVGGGGGLNKVCSLSPELQAIIGETELPRTQVVKQLWVYIREKSLQDPENKRRILCNDELRGLFGVESTDIFKMNKLLSKHIWPLDKSGDGDEQKPKKQKVEKKDSGGAARGRSTGPMPLSETLVEFLGTGETEAAQTEVVKRVWEYITENKLQDPADKRTIICDERLRDLFACDKFDGFNITKLLSPHFSKV